MQRFPLNPVDENRIIGKSVNILRSQFPGVKIDTKISNDNHAAALILYLGPPIGFVFSKYIRPGLILPKRRYLLLIYVQPELDDSTLDAVDGTFMYAYVEHDPARAVFNYTKEIKKRSSKSLGFDNEESARQYIQAQ